MHNTTCVHKPSNFYYILATSDVLVIPKERTTLRARHNIIVGPTIACKCACCINLRVTVSIWSQILEKFRKSCRPTISRIATIFICFENGTRVVIVPVGSFQFSCALSINIGCTCYSFDAPNGG